MPRIDYWHDPDAPRPNRVIPAATVAVRDEAGRLLLIHKITTDLWALPGGKLEPGESIADTAVREVAEETGVDVELTGLVGIYTDPGHVTAYDDGEVRQEFSVCFHARLVGGEAREDGREAKAVRWVGPSEIAELDIHPSMRRRIDDALDDRETPRIV